MGDALRGFAANVGPHTCERYFGFPAEQRLRVADPDVGWPYLATVLPQTDPPARPEADDALDDLNSFGHGQ